MADTITIASTPEGRLSTEQRLDLAKQLTDAVLAPEVEVTENALTAMAKGYGVTLSSPSGWTTLRTIDESSWGSRGSMLSHLAPCGNWRIHARARTAEIRNSLS